MIRIDFTRQAQGPKNFALYSLILTFRQDILRSAQDFVHRKAKIHKLHPSYLYQMSNSLVKGNLSIRAIHTFFNANKFILECLAVAGTATAHATQATHVSRFTLHESQTKIVNRLSSVFCPLTSVFCLLYRREFSLLNIEPRACPANPKGEESQLHNLCHRYSMFFVQWPRRFTHRILFSLTKSFLSSIH